MNVNQPGGAGSAPPDFEEIDLHQLSAGQLARLGVAELAYIKKVPTEGGGSAFAIHGADGTPMALAPDVDVAAAAIRQHDMVPALVH